MLTKALGCTPFVEADLMIRGFLKDDIIVMTSDGLTNMVSDIDIYNTIINNTENCANKLIDMANEAGGLDNITTVIVINN